MFKEFFTIDKKCILGAGQFGTVYKGRNNFPVVIFKGHDNFAETEVAIKVIEKSRFRPTTLLIFKSEYDLNQVFLNTFFVVCLET